MASDNVLELTDDNFEHEVVKSEKPVLVDFWADWCQPCHMIAPTVSELADEYAGRVKVGKLDTDANTNVAGRFGISAIPSILLFKGGEVVRKFVGVRPKQEFAAELERVIV